MPSKDPHKTGFLTKKGAVVKNWKRRYFVVNSDFSVSYYESEEAFKKNSKPKGVIHLAGYEVADSADNAKLEQLKSLAKKLGVDEESLPLPDKFPPHTLSLSHERRRDYYITAANEHEKQEWVEMFKYCCRKATGFQNTDPVAQAAFKAAYRRACYESSWYRRSDTCGGTEEQVLSETIVEIINYRVLSDVYSSLTGNFTIRKKVCKQVMKVLDSLVLAMVVPTYKGLTTSTENLKDPAEKTFNEKKDEMAEVQKKITKQLADKTETIVNRAVAKTTEDIKKMYEELKELARRCSREMRNECVLRLMERLVKDTKGCKDVEEVMKKNYRTFDSVVLSLTAWDHWYKVYNIEKEVIGIMNKYKETFNLDGDYSYVYTAHDILTKVADAAFFTFEELLKERIKETDVLRDGNKASEIMETVKNEVIPKYDADSRVTPEEISFKLTTTHVVEYFASKLDPLTKDIRKNLSNIIPEPLKQLISIQERYELYIEETVKELVRKTLGIVTSETNGNEGKGENDPGNDNDKKEEKDEVIPEENKDEVNEDNNDEQQEVKEENESNDKQNEKESSGNNEEEIQDAGKINEILTNGDTSDITTIGQQDEKQDKEKMEKSTEEELLKGDVENETMDKNTEEELLKGDVEKERMDKNTKEEPEKCDDESGEQDNANDSTIGT